MSSTSYRIILRMNYWIIMECYSLSNTHTTPYFVLQFRWLAWSGEAGWLCSVPCNYRRKGKVGVEIELCRASVGVSRLGVVWASHGDMLPCMPGWYECICVQFTGTLYMYMLYVLRTSYSILFSFYFLLYTEYEHRTTRYYYYYSVLNTDG